MLVSPLPVYCTMVELLELLPGMTTHRHRYTVATGLVDVNCTMLAVYCTMVELLELLPGMTTQRHR